MLIVVLQFYFVLWQPLAMKNGNVSICVIFVGEIIVKNIILKLFMIKCPFS